MNGQSPTGDSMSLEEGTISNMWEIAAIVEARKIEELRCTYYC